MQSRLGILALHDKDGMADDYVLYLLDELTQVSDFIVVVCNGGMRREAIRKLKRYADEVHIREDAGYDAGAFKYILNFYGWEQIRRYGEVILVNDSFFGPFKPLGDIFEEMDARKCDFWGLTAQPRTNCAYEVYGIDVLPYHIQPYFLAVRQRLLTSPVFQNFWDTLDDTDSYISAVVNYELRMTNYFESHGFTGLTYVDCTPFQSETGDDNLFLILDDTYRLLTNGKMPVVKKRCFSPSQESGLLYSINENAGKILHFIESETGYDTDMIWKNLIRNSDPSKLRANLHLDYVIPHKALVYAEGSEKKTAIFAYLCGMESIETCVSYLSQAPDTCDIYIMAQNSEVEKEIKDCWVKEDRRAAPRVRVDDSHGRDGKAMLRAYRDVCGRYDYICFIHDNLKMEDQIPAKAGMSYVYMLWENLLKNDCFIKNVIGLMERDVHLGLLIPPFPYHNKHMDDFGRGWARCYAGTRKLAHKMALNCEMSEENPPLTRTMAFWCKSKALKTLLELDLEREDFTVLDDVVGCIGRIPAFVSQHEGYATAVVRNDAYAGLELSNYSHMLTRLLDKKHLPRYCANYHDVAEFKNFSREADLSRLFAFCNKRKKLYIFGAGNIGAKVAALLSNYSIAFEGFIVTRRDRGTDFFVSKIIYEVGEIEERDIGIILGLNKRNASEVIPVLREHGFFNIYVLT